MQTYPREPPALSLNIRGVPQLTAGAPPHRNLMNGSPNVIYESLSEGMHVVCIAFQWGAALQHACLVCKQADVFLIAGARLTVSGPVSAEQSWVLLPTLQCSTTVYLCVTMYMQIMLQCCTTLYLYVTMYIQIMLQCSIIEYV